MYQGMVASVIGKFTNTSAHTSYLFLVKDPFPDSRVSPLSPAQKTCGSTISVCHDGFFSNRSPGAGRAAHYILTV
jgi:hypothetical protein